MGVELAAEQGLAELDLDWVALRLVLVYGAGVKGNMAQLLRIARSPYPLPFGALTARRSLLALDNLVEAVETVLKVREPLRRPLIVADPEPLTIPQMIGAMRQGLGRRAGGPARAGGVARGGAARQWQGRDSAASRR